MCTCTCTHTGTPTETPTLAGTPTETLKTILAVIKTAQTKQGHEEAKLRVPLALLLSLQTAAEFALSGSLQTGALSGLLIFCEGFHIKTKHRNPSFGRVRSL